MTIAYCFLCGSEKGSPMAVCGVCKKSPATGADVMRSLILSDEISTKAQLAHFANEVRSNSPLTAPDSLVAKARAVAMDPKYQLVLKGKQSPEASSVAPQRRPVEQPWAASPPSPIPKRPAPRITATSLHQSAFSVLGVTTRDNRKRIVELAEEKSLELDHDVCQKARSDLTTPRNRLSAEFAWLPGVSPQKASQLVERLLQDPMAVREESGLPTLAHLNLLAAAFEAVDGNNSADDVAEFIQEMACLVDDLSAEQVLRDINEDRSVSGFPEVKGVDQVEAELSDRRRYYRNAIKDALNRLPTISLVEAMTRAVDKVTCGGEVNAPELIDELVDSYAVETQGFLQKEYEGAQKLIKAAKDSAKSGESVVKPIVDKLEAVARNWDNVAQPIQLSAKSRGIDHEPSQRIAYSIRDLAIDLFNKYDMLTQSQRLTLLIQELFAELPEVVEQIEQDSEALEDIFQSRKETEAQKIRCSWEQVHIWSADGAFYIGAKDDQKTYVGLSYIHAANTHVLAQALQLAFKNPGMRRLSDVLQ
jgi:hypothetical protein